jgi:hypothetical protein
MPDFDAVYQARISVVDVLVSEPSFSMYFAVAAVAAAALADWVAVDEVDEDDVVLSLELTLASIAA